MQALKTSKKKNNPFSGGIGVTPFASILRTVRYRTERERATGIQQLPIRKVYFYWLSRDAAAFEWFSELLVALEDSDEVIFFFEKKLVS